MYVVRRWSNSNKILQCYKQYIDESSFSREFIQPGVHSCRSGSMRENLETKTEMSEEKKDDNYSTPVFLMTRERFNGLEAAVSGIVGDSIHINGGMMSYFYYN